MDALLEQDNFRIKQFPLPLPSKDGDSPSHLTTWPVLYVLTNSANRDAYIGETTNFKRRMSQHQKNPEKDFNQTLLIDSPTFNQSATFDYENRLIELFLADEKYHVTNRNSGFCALNYYQRPRYRQQFRSLWRRLQHEGYATHPIEEIENSDLYKYSPFKGLTPDQFEAIEAIIELVNKQEKSVTFVNGAPGTGKSILAVSLLFKLKTDPDFKSLKVALVSPMEQLRKTYRSLARSVEGLKPRDIIGPSDVAKDGPYDVLLVDEAHRMHDVHGAMMVPAYWKTCDMLGLNHDATQWDWIIAATRSAVFFFDPKQKVRATGMSLANREKLFDRLEDKGVAVSSYELSTQMRVQGGDEYLDFVYDILTGAPSASVTARDFTSLFSPLPYDASAIEGGDQAGERLYQFGLIDDFKDFCDLQREKEQECGLSRMAAGYAWEWASKKNPSTSDIEIEGIRKRWNSPTGGNWVNSEHAADEVGSIHTMQGYDLNYGFIIIGPDLEYDAESNRLIANKHSFFDRGAKKTATPDQLQSIVINAYYVLLTRGMRGTFVYACNPKVKEYLQQFIPTIARQADNMGWRVIS